MLKQFGHKILIWGYGDIKIIIELTMCTSYYTFKTFSVVIFLHFVSLFSITNWREHHSQEGMKVDTQISPLLHLLYSGH